MGRRTRGMDAQTAIDIADSMDLPDGAHFAMIGDLMGGEMTRTEVAKMLAGHPLGSSLGIIAAIFEAALTGVCANPNFDPWLDKEASQAAVNFALDCVISTLNAKEREGGQ